MLKQLVTSDRAFCTLQKYTCASLLRRSPRFPLHAVPAAFTTIFLRVTTGGPIRRTSTVRIYAGESNPTNFNVHRELLIRFSIQMPALTAAWLLTRQHAYADHAVAHLRAWVVDEQHE